MGAGDYRIPVPKNVYQLVKSYSINSGLTIGVVTQILYKSNVNVYDREKVFKLLNRYKRSRKI